MKLLALIVSLAISLPAAAQSIDQKVDALLAKMTLEEKIGQLLQFTPGLEPAGLLDQGNVGCMFNEGDPAKLREMQPRALQGSRLKIPILFAHDVIHGFRTIFPI